MRTIIFSILFFITTPFASYSQNGKLKTDTLPAPYATKSVKNFSNGIGWKDGSIPKAPSGFTVTKYADGFNNPRWIYITPNGDVLITESNSNHSLIEEVGGTILGANKSNNLSKSANVITLLRDTNKDGTPDLRETFLTQDQGLNQPFGILVIGKWVYVGNSNALLRYPYKAGQTKITEYGQKILDLPAGEHN